jgi:cytochrome c peroxidase
LNKVILILSILILAVVTGVSLSCKKEQNTDGLELLQQEVPTGFPQPNYTFSDNPLSKEGFELGRKLFYDGRLSVDNEHACGSCHNQIASFGTFEHDRSHGVYDTHTLRNAPILVNLAWNKSFDWDGAFSSLVDEAAHKLYERSTMFETYDGIIDKLNKDKDYPDAFKKVFRYPFIKPEFILKALAQFTGSMVSANSKYDRVKKGLSTFSAAEDRGYQLFKSRCASCHVEPLFTDFSMRNIGLPLDNFLKDYGRMRITHKSEDSLKFKVPTLRNLTVSSNYMHDGRFNTIVQVLNHYSSGIQQSPTLDPQLVNGIFFTNSQTNDLVLFLRTLTDSSFLTDPRFK